MKRWLLPALTSRPVALALRPLGRASVPIFMLHRFRHPGRPHGHDVATLRRRLADFRRDGVDFVSLERVVKCVRDGEPLPRRAVVFTVDDGYVDFASSGAAAFAEFDCPVTMFVATGFIDRQCWYWWDQVEWALTHTMKRSVDVPLGAETLHYAWTSTGEARTCAQALVMRMERVREEEKHAAIARLAASLEVQIPERVPDEFAPMTWDQMRALSAGGGVTFGPHTVTHPILAQTSDAQSEYEITESWRRLREESGVARVPVFCYPNGSDYALTMREVATMKRAGLDAALTTFHGYIDDSAHGLGPNAPFLMHRVGYADDELDYRQAASGFDRAKLLLRTRSQRVSYRVAEAPPSR